MFLINEDSVFKPAHLPNKIATLDDIVFVYNGSKVGLTAENKLPHFSDALLKTEENNFYCFGHINNHACLLWEGYLDVELSFSDARSSYAILSEPFYQAVAISSHLHHWRNAHRYCGKCANPMGDKHDERARICSECHHIAYPKISPCAIVLVTRGEEMLLARSPYFPPGIMSTLAGFVEIGESIEQTLIREVKEEVGIEVDNLKYMGSQPWPFPDSLMFGFTAEYKSGDLSIDKNEIESAGWFNKENLPPLPNKMSIARYLIEHHINMKIETV